jgi:5-methylcytosine-specific restriction endonuclease McrA
MARKVAKCNKQNTKKKKPRKYFGLPYSEYKKLRIAILTRDNHQCTKCGRKSNLHLHHIIYRSKGGGNELDNLITLCRYCHKETHKNEPVAHIM